MENSSSYAWGHDRRFNSYSEFLKKQFGSRIQKLTIDAGFTCPNRDGTVGTGGCTYCNNDAFNPSYCTTQKSISQQLQEGMDFHHVRYRRAISFLAYFQPYSNTYAPVEELRKVYEEALAFPGVIGLVIGTRPDCVNDEILDYIEEISKRAFVTVEYGIESCYNKSLKIINRGHDFETSVKALQETNSRGIRTGGHMIIGLPGESREEILAEAEILSSLPLNNLKFHQLQIVKETAMAEAYEKNPEFYNEYDLEDYLDLMVEFVENLNPAIVIERIAGETVPRFNLRHSWGLRYDQVLNRFEEKLSLTNTWQGKKLMING